MTDPIKPLDGELAANLLGEAVSIALDPSAGEGALRRGELLLAIAHEINTDAQWRAMRQIIVTPSPPIETKMTPKQASDTIRQMMRRPIGPYAFGRAGEDHPVEPPSFPTRPVDDVVARNLREGGWAQDPPSFARSFPTDLGEVAYDESGIVGGPYGKAWEPKTERTTVEPVRDAAPPDVTQTLPTVGACSDCRHCHTPILYAGEPVMISGDEVTVTMWRHKYTGQATCLAATMSSDASDVAHTFAEPEA